MLKRLVVSFSLLMLSVPMSWSDESAISMAISLVKSFPNANQNLQSRMDKFISIAEDKKLKKSEKTKVLHQQIQEADQSLKKELSSNESMMAETLRASGLAEELGAELKKIDRWVLSGKFAKAATAIRAYKTQLQSPRKY
jgi:hypothetical protein